MHSIPVLLSSQPSQNADPPDLTFVEPDLPLADDDDALTNQALQALESYAHTHLQPQSTHTNAAAFPSTNSEADPVDDHLVPWEFALGNSDWLGGGIHDEFPE